MQIRGVLFDFGSTLFAHIPLADTIERAAARLGAQVDTGWALQLAGGIDAAAHAPDELALRRDLSTEVWASRWPVLYALGDSTVPGLGAEIYRLMHDPAEWRPYPATRTVLAALATSGIPIGVVSNTGWDIRTVFDHHELGGFIDQYCLSWQVGSVKPDAAIFSAALQHMGLDASDTVMVGDDATADAGAARAGLATLLLPATPPGVDNRLELVLGLCGIR